MSGADVDVAVAGAGLGGLAAAAHLAGEGLRVALFEAQPRPGGVATSFSRAGYTFDASLHLLDAAGPGAPNRWLLEDLDIAHRLELRQGEILWRQLWPGRGWDLRIAHGTDGLLDALEEVFPTRRTGARELMEMATALHDEATAFLRGEVPTARVQQQMLALMGRTGAEVVGEYVSDPAAIELLGAVSAYRGLDVWEIGAVPFLMALVSYHRWVATYPVGGSQALTRALVEVIDERGGSLHTGRGVARLASRRGAVHGLVLEDGTEVRARAVVSAVSPLVTFLEWLDEDDLPRRYRDRVAGMAPSSSLVRLSLGLDVDPRALAPVGHETWIIGERGEPLSSLTVTAPAALDPTCAPPGGGVLALASRRVDGLAFDSSPARARVADQMVELAERHVLPDLARHVVVRELAHPSTYRRYTGAPAGAVFGFAPTPAQGGLRRLGAATPVRNLTLAGGWVFPGAGQAAAMWSGRLAARRVLETML